ncbi:citrate/2-methylcitrate synthase [Amycolatopsis halotolerans]|uniref:citrate synthase (unknown stereospecificity) n=1 Tax=Amycolatopsis halotolerans TaxID=330083 RepID=A0ABV7QUC3_9PSEU
MDGEWMTAAEAADRLGVTMRTLYAYASRGVLTSRPVRGGGGRRSQYERAQVEALADRTAKRERAGRVEIRVETAVADLRPAGALAFRGYPIEDLLDQGFENVAELLWTADLPSGPVFWPNANRRETARVLTALPETAGLLDRMSTVVSVLGMLDPARSDRGPAAVADVGRRLIPAMAAAISAHADPHPAPGSVAATITDKLARGNPVPSAPVDLALCLLADHELAASTFASRVAATAGADPYSAVDIGIQAMRAVDHGGTARDVHRMLRRVAEEGLSTVESNARRDGALPGFGHPVYTGFDPRAPHLLAALERVHEESDRLNLVRTVRESATRRGLPKPNIDFALGALTWLHSWPEEASTGLVVVARTAGWLAHAAEAYERPSRIRPRAVYIGSRPRRR